METFHLSNPSLQQFANQIACEIGSGRWQLNRGFETAQIQMTRIDRLTVDNNLIERLSYCTHFTFNLQPIKWKATDRKPTVNNFPIQRLSFLLTLPMPKKSTPQAALFKPHPRRSFFQTAKIFLTFSLNLKYSPNQENVRPWEGRQRFG